MASKFHKTFEIEIKNWEKYNPNKKHFHNKMMISVDFLSDVQILNCSTGETLLYLSCILAASKKSQSRVRVDTRLLQLQSRVRAGQIQSCLHKLQSLGLLTILEEPEQIRKSPQSRVELSRVELSRDEKSKLGDLFGTELALPSPVLEYPTDLLLFKSVFIERKVKPKTVQSWLENFNEPDWIGSELKKALVWETGNPRRKKKDFGRFFSGWLVRAWDSRRTNNDRTAIGREARNINALQEALARK